MIEIRDAQLVLRPYSTPEVAGLAAAEARESRLPPDRAAAVVEAAVIVSSLQWRVRGSVRRHADPPEDHVGAMPGNDIPAEAVRLILVCHAICRSRVVRRIAGQAPTRVAHFPSSHHSL